MEIGVASQINSVCLMPNQIKFELAQSFNIDLYKMIKSMHEKEKYVQLMPNYDLGYIFGTYLGDGHARSIYNKKRKSYSGGIVWSFGKNEIDIAKKLRGK